jgi:hypothetical protein
VVVLHGLGAEAKEPHKKLNPRSLCFILIFSLESSLLLSSLGRKKDESEILFWILRFSKSPGRWRELQSPKEPEPEVECCR